LNTQPPGRKPSIQPPCPPSLLLLPSASSVLIQLNLYPLYLSSIEIATRAADNFTRIYYTAYDSPTRLSELPKLYRPTSALTWNGTPFQGSDGLLSLVQNMPPTKHEIQSFDCHPIPGSFTVLFIHRLSLLTVFRHTASFAADRCLWERHPWPRPLWQSVSNLQPKQGGPSPGVLPDVYACARFGGGNTLQSWRACKILH
jgi:hypothetical protein